MSIAIMSQLFKAHLGSTGRKMLAVRLADFADDDGRGIWPTVGRLAQETELSERTVQRFLAEFVDEGLLVIRKKGGSKPGEATRYDFDMGAIGRLKSSKHAADGCHGVTHDTVSPMTPATAMGDTDDSYGCHGVTQTVIEPPIEPLEREGAREAKEDRKTIPGTAEFQKRVQIFLSGDGYNEGEWPKWAKNTTLKYITDRFAALTEELRKEAEQNRDAFLLKSRGDGGTVMGAGNYFRDLAWRALSERDRNHSRQLAARRTGSPSPETPENWAKAYGPVHAAMLFRILCGGPDNPGQAPSSGLWLSSHVRAAWPRLAAFWQRTDMHSGVTAEDRDFELSAGMEWVSKESELMSAWRSEFKARGLPDLRMPEGMGGGYFPKGGPDGFHQFELAAKERGDEHAA